MSLPRSAKIILGIVAALVVTIGLCVVLLLNFDWNRARPWLNERVSESTGRSFIINGPLSLTWQKAPDGLHSWSRWIPWPRLTAQDIRVGQPEMDVPPADAYFAEIAQLTFSLNPLPLLDNRISIPLLQLDSPRIALQRTTAGGNNWTFRKSPQSKWELNLDAIAMKEGSIHLVDAIRKADVTAQLNSMETLSPEGYGISWTADGKVGQQAVKGRGKLGTVIALKEQTSPFPLEGVLDAGQTRISVSGTVTKPSAVAAINVHLKLSGPSAALLFQLSGINLPETPTYSTAGRLHGTFKADGAHWTYDRFTGKVGNSDIAGTLDYTDSKPRGMLKGTVVSKQLRLEDLGTLIGAGAKAKKAEVGARSQPADKVLPVQAFKTERWTTLDADVKFTGESIIHRAELPVDRLQTHLIMDAGVLQLTPLDFGVAGGTIKSQITLDGRQPLIKGNMTIVGRKLNLSRLFPTLKPMEASIGQLNTDASLSATGDSIASMLGNANGELKALVDGGTISKLLMEKAGLNLGSVVLTTLVGDKQIQLNCVAGDFAVTKGVMQTRSLIIDTEDALISVDGTVDLNNERLNLVIRPETKGIRIVTLRAPLYVTGPFKAPKVSVDTGQVALKAGIAATLAAIAPPLAALLPLANMGKETPSKCNELLSAARVEPVAPPPGKTARTPVHARQ